MWEMYRHISRGPGSPEPLTVTRGAQTTARHARAPTSVPGAGVLANAHQKVILSEVLVPRRVQKTVGSSEDPAVTDEAGPAQQLLGTLPEKHHLPGRRSGKH